MRAIRSCCLFLLLIPVISFSQFYSSLSQKEWTDSVFNSLNDDQKIAQLMVIRAHSNLGQDHIDKVTNDIKKYNIGALCFFQGGPVRQANLTNYYQRLAKTPIMITIDGEWGLGMRLDSVTKFPYQLTLGALNDDQLIYKMGVAVGEQCKRLGVHVNYAPVVDINNNPHNPVIGYRSFGEDKDKVARYGVAYMKGMQDAGIMACAKHFPGHGDVDVDSHYDLPVINKTRAQLDTLELMPFKAVFNAGIGSVMIAHLYIPSIDSTINRATSISKNNVTDLLQRDMGYKGLTFTDALEMKGVAKYFPGGTIAVEALIAGNDMLCLPASVPETIEAVKKAIADKKLSWAEINAKVMKVLNSKYELGLNSLQPINTVNLLSDLNKSTDDIKYEVAKNSITLLQSPTKNSLLSVVGRKKILYLSVGNNELNDFGRRMKADLKAEVLFFSYKDDASKAAALVNTINKQAYDMIVIGVHNYSLKPMDNFGLSASAIKLVNDLNSAKAVTMTFGNVGAGKSFCNASTLVCCYQDDAITQQAAADYLEGKFKPRGSLPVTVCNYKYGDGMMVKEDRSTIHDMQTQLASVDSIAMDAIAKKAFPGCVVMAVHNGEIIYHKAFGNYEYESSPAMKLESIFDLASVTKVSATTVSVMKLFEEGRLDLNKTLGDYLPWVKGSDKAPLRIDHILLHQAGLVPFIPFYKETLDSASGIPNPSIYSTSSRPGFTIRVAEGLYMRNDWNDTILSRIVKSKLSADNKYVYSDNDFIFLGKIVEQLTGTTLDSFAQKTFYNPMGMVSTGFKPRNRFTIDRMVPTERETQFRRQLIDGDVHDEGASLFGGVAGHAGLFSDAYDLAMLYQMLLNGGEFNGRRYLNESTIKYFTAYHSDVSRRGFGFDKPEKDNATRKEPYPSASASAETFGHTGFTGTCVWVDPKTQLVYVFLSNRVYPTRDNPRFGNLNVRPRIQEVLYHAIAM